jgi:hypothetical protein
LIIRNWNYEISFKPTCTPLILPILVGTRIIGMCSIIGYDGCVSISTGPISISKTLDTFKNTANFIIRTVQTGIAVYENDVIFAFGD